MLRSEIVIPLLYCIPFIFGVVAFYLNYQDEQYRYRYYEEQRRKEKQDFYQRLSDQNEGEPIEQEPPA